MADENATPETTPEPTIMERLEADLQEARAALEAAPKAVEALVQPAVVDTAAKVAQLHQHIDTFWGDVVRNISGQIPLAAHNTLHDLKEALRARLVDLISKEI